MSKTDPDKDEGDKAQVGGYNNGSNNDTPEPHFFHKRASLRGHIILLQMNLVGVHGFKGSRFKVPFSSAECIWDTYLREKRQFRQA